MIGPAYFGVGYISWVLARAILGDRDAGLRGALAFSVPAIASFIMVSWDLTMDPLMATIRHNWIWEQGGSYFGVPVSNFLGWYLTVFVFFQVFALYARHLPRDQKRESSGSAQWLQALLAYVTILIQPILELLANDQSAPVTDAAGIIWQNHDIRSVGVLIGLFTLVPFGLIALFRSTVGENARQAIYEPRQVDSNYRRASPVR